MFDSLELRFAHVFGILVAVRADKYQSAAYFFSFLIVING